jgi:hypothetical protein
MNNRIDQKAIASSLLRSIANENFPLPFRGEKPFPLVPQKARSLADKPALGARYVGGQLKNAGTAAWHGFSEQAEGMKRMLAHPVDESRKIISGIGTIAQMLRTREGWVALGGAIKAGYNFYVSREHWGEGLGKAVSLIAPMMIPIGGGAGAVGAGIMVGGMKATRVAGQSGEILNAAAKAGRMARFIEKLKAPFAKTLLDNEGFIALERRLEKLNGDKFLKNINEIRVTSSDEAALAYIKENSVLLLEGLQQDRAAIEALQKRHYLDSATANKAKWLQFKIDTSSSAILDAVKGNKDAWEVKWCLEGLDSSNKEGAVFTLATAAKSLANEGRAALNLRQRTQLWLSENIQEALFHLRAYEPGSLSPKQVRAAKDFRSLLRAFEPDGFPAGKLSLNEMYELKKLYGKYRELEPAGGPGVQFAFKKFIEKMDEYTNLENFRGFLGKNYNSAFADSYKFNDLRALHGSYAEYEALKRADKTNAAGGQLLTFVRQRQQIEELRAAGYTHELNELDRFVAKWRLDFEQPPMKAEKLGYLRTAQLKHIIDEAVAAKIAGRQDFSQSLFHIFSHDLARSMRGETGAYLTRYDAPRLIELADFQDRLPHMKSIGVKSAEKFTPDDLAHISARKAIWDDLRVSAWKDATDEEAGAAIAQAGTRLREEAMMIERLREAGHKGAIDYELQAFGKTLQDEIGPGALPDMARYVSREELAELKTLYEKIDREGFHDDVIFEGTAVSTHGKAVSTPKQLLTPPDKEFQEAFELFDGKLRKISWDARSRAGHIGFFREKVTPVIGLENRVVEPGRVMSASREIPENFLVDDLEYLRKGGREVIIREAAVQNADIPVPAAILGEYHQALEKLIREFIWIKRARVSGNTGSTESILHMNREAQEVAKLIHSLVEQNTFKP